MKKNNSTIITLLSILGFTVSVFAQTVSTVAGTTQGYLNGANSIAQFDSLFDICVDTSGNLYVADQNNTIRKISVDGTTSTFAGSTTSGSTDGMGTDARFYTPNGMCIDASGNIYISDYNNSKIRKITPAGVVSTLAGSGQGYHDGPGNTAQFYLPQSVCVDAAGNVYVADCQNHKIRKITANGTVSTFAGSTQGSVDGTGTAAQFEYPGRICVDKNGNVYVTEMLQRNLRKITPDGIVTTLLSNAFNIQGMCTDTMGNIYMADYYGNVIRKLTPEGSMTIIAGSGEIGYQDGDALSAQFHFPTSVCMDAQGNLYVTDRQNFMVRKITGATLGNQQNPVTAASLTIYPNPVTSGVLNFESNVLITDVTIYDVSGKQLSENKMYSNTVNVSMLASGIYFLKFQSENSAIFKKIVISQ